MTGWTALLGALGGVAIVFALLSLLLLVFGAPTDPGWIWANLVAGVVLLGVALLSNLDALRERMSSGEARRVGKYGTSALLSTLLSIAILGGLAFLASRNKVRFDWTESGVHSLSDQTQKVLGGLDRDVEVVAFYSALDMPGVRALLDRYAYESDRFQVTYADPNSRPDLTERFNLTREKLSGGLLHVTLGDESTEVTDLSEERLTNALVKLTRTAEKYVYFVTGHNERPALGDAASGEGGFGRAAEALRNENYLLEELVLGTVNEVPERADVVIVAGPTRNFLPAEHTALARYLERGGALLVMVDPAAETDLYESLASWGVEVGNNLVIDQVQGLFGRPATPLAGAYGDHPITRDLREVTLFHVARSVDAVATEAEGEATLIPIVRTGEESWAEIDFESQPEFGPGDTAGPVPIAVAGTPRLGAGGANGEAPGPDAGLGAADVEPRLVVFGDSDFAANELLDAYRNRDLFLNSVNWLLGDVEAISIRPNLSRASRFQLSAEQFNRVRTLSLFVLPEAIAVLGAVAWWSRRRAPGR